MPENTEEYVLKVENLKAFYTSKKGLVRAVNNITFSIRKGESVGLFGESGAGKTSVALAIMGIFDEVSRYYASASSDPENKKLWEKRDKARKKGLTSEDLGIEFPGVEGKIWFQGRDLLTLDDKEYRKIRGMDITYVPQGTTKSLNPYTEVGAQTSESLWAHDEDNLLIEREVLRKVLETLDLVEIGDSDLRQFMKPGEFSMGEDQRILIAMALISDPSLMITDEPTTAVDVGVQRRILDAIGIVRRELDLSLLLISNDQGLIAETSDRVAVMSAGHIMEFGEVERVLKSPGHPFTRAFIMSNPSMEIMRKIREKGLRLRGIPGKPPDLTNPPTGCPFHPRCEYVKDICKSELPAYREADKDYWIFCHRYEELPDW
ncbi:MAG: oligopeptide/dipeptide ABC transporter ATP-binding protein [Candidatus Thorarchaeota archaeon]|jgi:oligopeptide/dipeptide ABC transporter ATP-binding protein